MQDKMGLKIAVEGRHATWLELFYDLIYVIVIAKLTHMMGHTHDGHMDWHYYLQSVALFVPVWWCWTGHTMFANRFDADDTMHRLLTLSQMFGALMMAVFIENALGEGAVGFILSYVGIRLLLIVMYLRVHVASKDLRHITRLFSIGFSLGVACWIASLFVDGPLRYALWAVGLFIDFATPWVGQKRLAKVSVHKEHLPERLGLLTIIILGESVLGIVIGVDEVPWGGMTLSNMVLGFVLLCTIWWLYFETLEHVLAGKILRSGQLSIYGHLPIYLGLVTLSAGLLHQITGNISLYESMMLLTGGLALILVPLHIIQLAQSHAEIRKKLMLGISVLYSALACILFFHHLMPSYAPLLLLTCSTTAFLVWEHKGKHVW